MQPYIIAPSILSANLAKLGEEVNAVLHAGADWVHIDVMDNHYVPNLTFGPQICRALRQFGVTAPIDVHLMVQPVDDLITAFAKAGATLISFHPEASRHIDRSLQLIHDQGCQAGLALNPSTPLSVLDYVFEKLDFILLMSVNPGFGGQHFIPMMLNKIQQTHQLIVQHNPNIRLEVDGGVSLDNIADLARAGADAFVMGTAVYSTSDYNTTLKNIRSALATV